MRKNPAQAELVEVRILTKCVSRWLNEKRNQGHRGDYIDIAEDLLDVLKLNASEIEEEHFGSRLLTRAMNSWTGESGMERRLQRMERIRQRVKGYQFIDPENPLPPWAEWPNP
jgi:Zn-dependent M16 (insulinase) family peptidase